MNLWLSQLFKNGVNKFLKSRLLCQKVCLCSHYLNTNSITITGNDYKWLLNNTNAKICFYDKTGIKTHNIIINIVTIIRSAKKINIIKFFSV